MAFAASRKNLNDSPEHWPREIGKEAVFYFMGKRGHSFFLSIARRTESSSVVKTKNST
jgi:hypothetical protein